MGLASNTCSHESSHSSTPSPPLRVSGWLAPFQSSLLQTEVPQSFSPLTSVHLTEVSPWLAHLGFLSSLLFSLSLFFNLQRMRSIFLSFFKKKCMDSFKRTGYLCLDSGIQTDNILMSSSLVAQRVKCLSAMQETWV